MKALRATIRKLLSESIDARATEATKREITFSIVDDGWSVTVYCLQNSQEVGRLDCKSTWINESIYIATDAGLPRRLIGFGIGSLMFDIMVAYLSKKRIWMAPDTRSVSKEAISLYEWYYNHPETYSQKQLDISPRRSDKKHFLTSETDDDFDIHSVFSYIGGHSDPNKDEYSNTVYDDEEYKKKYIDHCLTKAYKMKNYRSFINNLPKGLVRWS